MTEGIDLKDIENIVASAGRGKEDLVAILHAVHEKYNYLPAEVMEYIPEITDISPSDLWGVATFYSQFRLKPAGQHFIKVCIGTACHIKGAEDLYENFKKYLNIPEDGDTDTEKVFTVMKVACLGCCMLAPAVQIDDITYGPVSSEGIPGVLKDFLEAIRSAGGEAEHTAVKDGVTGSIKVCTCSSCVAAGAGSVFLKLKNFIKESGVKADLKSVGCTGISFQAPLVEIETPDRKTFRYVRVKPEDAPAIVSRHFRSARLSGRVRQSVDSLLRKIYAGEPSGEVQRYSPGIRDHCPNAYIEMQKQIATEYGGRLDPLDINEYIGNGGFTALAECLRSGDPDTVIDTIRNSALRGRGGAGYPTAAKWSQFSSSGISDGVIICNGDEGDPGAFMDRMLMESFPFRVIEGMAVAAFACGITRGRVYVRSEYPLAVDRMTKAIKICAERGILRNNPAKKDFSLDIKVFVSAGAFVCGEETALISSIEGKRGNPKLRPPYPSEKGFRGKPTLINNVETFALVPWIIRHGADRFAGMGTGKSSGTKTFALAGKIRNGGLVEVEMGITVNDIVHRIGGGLKDGRKFKAVQVGGPSGGCLPGALADTPVDYEQLKELGAIMGSGGMIVLDEDDCVVDVAKYFMSFTQSESCGKCTFCRVGTMRMYEMLDDITRGKGGEDILKRLKLAAIQVKDGSLCGLGRSAPNPVLSALKYFEEEFNEHIQGRCPAKKCKALIKYRITDKCIGCTKCAQRCPQDAIKAKPYEMHEIDQELCVKCDVCRQICPSEAVVRE